MGQTEAPQAEPVSVPKSTAAYTAGDTAGDSSFDVIPEFEDIVARPKSADAAVARERASIESEGVKEELETNIRALNLAADRLVAAQAEADKAELLAQQKAEEEHIAAIAVERAMDDATAGSTTINSQETAKSETADLAAVKRAYLLSRATYAESTTLVKTRQEELASATAETNEMEKMFEEAKAEAEAAKVKADEMAVAMDEHRETTKADAAVGEEEFKDGVSRSQTMAQITAAATQQEITAGELFTVAADKKKAWTDAAMRQKTAQETLDHEVARNAELKVQSNLDQKAFIDASNVAAQDATAAADASHKAKAALEDARVKLAAAQDARKKAEEERDHLRFDILVTRKAEYLAQQRKTDALKAKAGVIDAVAGAAEAANEVEKIKANVLHDAQEATVDRKFYDAEAEAAKAKAARDDAASIATANEISAAAAYGDDDHTSSLAAMPQHLGADAQTGESSTASAEATRLRKVAEAKRREEEAIEARMAVLQAAQKVKEVREAAAVTAGKQ